MLNAASFILVKPGTPHKLEKEDRPTFDEYKERIDRILFRCVGLGLDDLPDAPVLRWYNERKRPIYAAKAALRWAETF